MTVRRRLGGVLVCALAAALLVLAAPPARAVNMQITVGLVGEMAPLQYADESGAAAGVHNDLLTAFSDEKNLVRCRLYESQEDGFRALQSGEVDACLVASPYSESTLAPWATEPLTTISLCAISAAEDSRPPFGETVAAFEYGTVNYTYLSKLGVACYLAVGSQQEVLEALRTKQASLGVGLRDCLLYQMEKDGCGDDYTIVRSHLGELSYALVVRQGDTVLLRWLEERLVNLRSTGAYDEIYNRWAAQWTKDPSVLLSRTLRYLMIAFASALLILLAVVAFSAALKRQLGRMTRTLHETNDQLALQLAKVQRENMTQQQIIDASTLSIVLFDQQGCITMLNQEAARIAQDRSLLTGRRIQEIFPFNQIVTPELLRGEDAPLPQNRVFRVRQGDGALTLLKCTVVRLPSDETGEKHMLLAEDITAEELRKQKIFEAEKSTTLNRVVAGIAHEIRNPLMTIRTFAKIIPEEQGDEEFQTAFREIVPAEVDRINALVDRFINYAKPSDAQQSVVDASALVRDCLYLTNPVARQSKIRFDIDLQDGLLVRISETQIKQVLINVIINGIEAMERRLCLEKPERKLVMQIKTCAEGQRAAISVRDEGVGMTPEELEQCRVPYFTTKPQGIGLGLVVSDELVRLNGGTMQIESRVCDHTQITISFAREELN